jgi:hypothetical protein
MKESRYDAPGRDPRPAATTKQSLTGHQQKLVALLQRVRYGRVHVVRVRCGQPDVTDVRWTRTVKVLGENGPHPLSAASDFHLGREVTEFFRLLAAIQDGEIRNIEVRNGLPFTFEVEDSVAP